MNKGSGGQQRFLRNGWYINNKKTLIQQEMTFLKPGITPDMPPLRVQKGIQMVLEERGLWPGSGLRLSREKQKCSSCQAASFILKENDANLVSSLKNIVTNVICLAFVMSMFAAKNVVNAYKKNIVLGARNTQVKNLAKSVTNAAKMFFIR